MTILPQPPEIHWLSEIKGFCWCTLLSHKLWSLNPTSNVSLDDCSCQLKTNYGAGLMSGQSVRTLSGHWYVPGVPRNIDPGNASRRRMGRDRRNTYLICEEREKGRNGKTGRRGKRSRRGRKRRKKGMGRGRRDRGRRGKGEAEKEQGERSGRGAGGAEEGGEGEGRRRSSSSSHQWRWWRLQRRMGIRRIRRMRMRRAAGRLCCIIDCLHPGGERWKSHHVFHSIHPSTNVDPHGPCDLQNPSRLLGGCCNLPGNAHPCEWS